MLRDAYQGPPIAPMRRFLDPLDVEGAYAVQALNTRHWLAEGRVLVGRKVGLTAKAVQQQIGVSQPDFGALFADMRIADGGVLNPFRAIQPKAEAEIAFIMGCGIDDPEASLERSEEHTSELQSLMRISYDVFCLKKKNKLKSDNE